MACTCSEPCPPENPILAGIYQSKCGKQALIDCCGWHPGGDNTLQVLEDFGKAIFGGATGQVSVAVSGGEDFAHDATSGPGAPNPPPPAPSRIIIGGDIGRRIFGGGGLNLPPPRPKSIRLHPTPLPRRGPPHGARVQSTGEGLSTGAKVGIAAATVAGVGGLGALAWMFFGKGRKRRRRR